MLTNRFSSDQCLIIAEVAQAHEGSLALAHSYIDAVSAAGADAVKFQTHIAKAETTVHEPWRVRFRTQDLNRYNYWRRMEFSEPQWIELAEHAKEKNLLFLSSPFSQEAVDILVRAGVDAWKVASGEISNLPLLEKILKFPKPIILSSGMSTIEELTRSVEMIKPFNVPLYVLQCTSSYPCPPESVGLNMISEFKKKFGTLSGLSDHTASIYSSLAAISLGADLVEVHVTFSRDMFSPDASSSLTMQELKSLVEGRNFIRRMLANPIDKNLEAEKMLSMRKIFSKSIVAAQNLESGQTLDQSHLTFKKPGNGLPPDELHKIVGRRLKVSIKADEVILVQDVE